MVRICANAASIGQASAAGVARLIHETKGFVVMDDLESVGTRSGKDASQFNELIQALKLSYNKETSWKIWTDVSRGMRVERLNFFGVKMINNTTGADNHRQHIQAPLPAAQ
jgi:acid phosphatase family membrane protein YuiD